MSEAGESVSSQPAKKVAKKAKRKPQNQEGGDGSSAKKVATAYHVFLRERIPRLKQEQPELNPKDYLPTVCATWRALSSEEKQVYAEQAKEENVRKSNVITEEGDTERRHNGGSGGGGKKVATAYHMFLRERIPKLKQEQPELNPKEYISTVCTIWRALGDEEKQVYNEMAREENVRKASAVAEVRREDGETERRIPIFTQAFILHNRDREKEFRRLQKETNETQQQAALLSAHSDSLRTAINKLENEVASQRSRSQRLVQKLEDGRGAVMEALVDISGIITEKDDSSTEVFKSFSTSELLSNLRTSVATSFDDLNKQQRNNMKTVLLNILNNLSSESPQPPAD